MNEAVLTAPEFLCEEIPLLLFGGKGGVGKTTLACATALKRAASWPEQRFVLASTDPAHSVRDALGEMEIPENLEVVEIDATAEHALFMDEHGGALQAIGERGTFLTEEEIRGFLELSVPGVDELMSFVRLSRWVAEERADGYVIDTAPTGHALRLLGMPETLDRWLEAVEAFLGKHRYMASVFGGGGDDPVEDFLDSMRESFDTVAEALGDERLARFVPVMNAEPMSVSETARLLGTLDGIGVASPEVVVNRWAPGDCGGAVGAMALSQREAMASAPGIVMGRRLWACPLQGEEPRGAALATLTHELSPWGTAIENAAPEVRLGAPGVRGTLDLRDEGARLVALFAGKGGVGKTTMACASALALAASGTRTMLVSTDPAGSLGDALGMEIGERPARVAAGLEAMQLDAEAEFDALREAYADELEGFMDQLLGGADLAFDREAMEALMDLAPTGLDEVMALVRVTELLEELSLDALVLDTAPSGHLLRLLELPELVESWLTALFRVLVTYESVFSLPRLNERLLRLSRGLKSLRALLVDSGSCRVIGVSAPTRLASAETERLIERCGSLGVGVGGLIVNRVTPEGGDGIGAALAARERVEIERLRAMAGDRPVVEVEYGAAPSGVEMLGALGTQMMGGKGARRVAA